MEKKKHMSESDIESLIDHIGSKIACIIHNNKLYVIKNKKCLTLFLFFYYLLEYFFSFYIYIFYGG